MNIQELLFLLFLTAVVPYVVWVIPFVRRTLPLVVIQIAAGVILGPSVFGAIDPDGFARIFTPSVIAFVGNLGVYAVCFFVFETGMHLDIQELFGRGAQGRAFLATAFSSLFIPFSLALVGGYIFLSYFPEFAGPNASMATFVLAFATALGVTALPVLAATVKDMGMHDSGSRAGRMSIACATFNDLLLWILLAVLLTLAGAGSAHGPIGGNEVFRLIGFSILYFGVMFGVIRPLLAWMLEKRYLDRRATNGQLVFVLSLIVPSAYATEAIGLHALLGAFTAGVVVPKEMVQGIKMRIDKFVECFLLGFFFMSTGLKTVIDIGSSEVFVLAFVTIMISSFGKFFGTAFPAKWTGLHRTWRGALSMGGFMQCKGLMEVVVLKIMLDAGIISVTCFSGLILMALVTTAVTKPVVLIVRKVFPRDEPSMTTQEIIEDRRVDADLEECHSENDDQRGGLIQSRRRKGDKVALRSLRAAD